VPEPDIAARCRAVSARHRTASGVTTAVENVSLDVEAGVLTVIAGPSGSGKSSLLRVVAGLHRPSAGTVEIGGVDITALRAGPLRRLRRRAMGIVLQDPADNLVSYLTAAEQIELAARLRGVGTDEVATLLATVGLTERATSLPATMSGGEQQRIAFAAAAIGAPRVLLADEPTAELDARAGDDLIRTMLALARAGSTLIVTSHDPALIAAADRTVTLQHGSVVEEQEEQEEEAR
jgi:putative ABC transport system ATP-binding protein